jgi:hypothetical protein
MNAITVWQPWASLIAHLDKRVENRTWRPPAKLLGKRIAIHAGKRWDTKFPERHQPTVEQLRRLLWLKMEPYPLGAIVATAVLAGFALSPSEVPAPQVRWFAGPFAWLLGDVHALAAPIPCLGAQGFWILPQDVEAEIERQMVA